MTVSASGIAADDELPIGPVRLLRQLVRGPGRRVRGVSRMRLVCRQQGDLTLTPMVLARYFDND